MRDRVLEGRSNRDLAIKYEISENHLSIITNSPLWKKEENALHDSLIKEHQSKLLTLVPSAIKTLEEVVQRNTSFDVVNKETGESKQVNVTNPPATRLKASEMICKMAGVSKEEDSSDKSIIINLYKPAWNKEGGGEVIDVEL